MTLASSDGRPPTKPQRMLEWRWFGVGAAVIIAGIATWIVIAGVNWGAIVVGLTLGVLLLVGASPVLAAGLLRGREERAARTTARLERQGRSVMPARGSVSESVVRSFRKEAAIKQPDRIS